MKINIKNIVIKLLVLPLLFTGITSAQNKVSAPYGTEIAYQDTYKVSSFMKLKKIKNKKTPYFNTKYDRTKVYLKLGISTNKPDYNSYITENKSGNSFSFDLGVSVDEKINHNLFFNYELIFEKKFLSLQNDDTNSSYDIMSIKIPATINFAFNQSLFIYTGAYVLKPISAKEHNGISFTEEDKVGVKGGISEIDYGMKIGLGYTKNLNSYQIYYDHGMRNISLKESTFLYTRSIGLSAKCQL